MAAQLSFTAPAACGCLVQWTARRSGADGEPGAATVSQPGPCPTHEEPK